MTDLRGRAFGGFTIVSLLGRGGMGEVYRALTRDWAAMSPSRSFPPEIAASAIAPRGSSAKRASWRR